VYIYLLNNNYKKIILYNFFKEKNNNNKSIIIFHSYHDILSPYNIEILIQRKEIHFYHSQNKFQKLIIM